MLGLVFFFRQISTFQLNIFDGFFKYLSKNIDVLSFNLKIYFLCSFFVKLWMFKECHFGQFRTNNARYISLNSF